MIPGAKWACIARQGGFGDNLIASSVLPGLKKRYDFVEVITNDFMGCMFENNPFIDKLTVLAKDRPEWGDGHTWQKWYYERSKEYAFFANLSHSCEGTGVAMKAQTQYWWPDSIRRKLFNRSYLELVHDICEIPYDEIAPDFYPTDSEKVQAAETKAKVGSKVIGWLSAGSRIDKHHHMADVMIARAIKELNIPVIVLGAPGRDAEMAKLITTEVQKHNRTTDGLFVAISPDHDRDVWGPRRIATQTQFCDIVIGPDTGPMWAVAMHDMPKVQFASHAGLNVTKHWVNTTTLHADPERVPCWPCHRLHDDNTLCTPNADKNGAACISDVTVDKVLETVSSFLKEK